MIRERWLALWALLCESAAPAARAAWPTLLGLAALLGAVPLLLASYPAQVWGVVLGSLGAGLVPLGALTWARARDTPPPTRTRSRRRRRPWRHWPRP